MIYLTISLAVLSALLLGLTLWLILRYRRLRGENERLRSLVNMSSKSCEADLQALRRLRHDLRHYIISGGDIPDVDPALTSSGSAVDAITEHYRREAAGLGLTPDLLLDLGQCGDELLPDVCLIVSNLLENAVRTPAPAGSAPAPSPPTAT